MRLVERSVGHQLVRVIAQCGTPCQMSAQRVEPLQELRLALLPGIEEAPPLVAAGRAVGERRRWSARSLIMFDTGRRSASASSSADIATWQSAVLMTMLSLWHPALIHHCTRTIGALSPRYPPPAAGQFESALMPIARLKRNPKAKTQLTPIQMRPWTR